MLTDEINWTSEMSIQRKSYSITGGPHKQEIMKEEYVFPYNNWYLKFDECDRELVDNWRINIVKYSGKPCPNNYINYRGAGGTSFGGGVLITIDQFKQYVLNIQEPIINENYDYLIPILSKII